MYGNVGLVCLKSKVIKKNQIESARIIIKRIIKKFGKLYISNKFFIFNTKKPKGIRMGKGKGPLNYEFYQLKNNEIIFELQTNYLKANLLAFNKASKKLPFFSKIIYKYNKVYYNGFFRYNCIRYR